MSSLLGCLLVVPTALGFVFEAAGLRPMTPSSLDVVKRPQRRFERQLLVSSSSSSIPDALPANILGDGPKPPSDLLDPALSKFLTQRAVQMQLYYFDLNLDETNGVWLKEFLRPPHSPRFHSDYHGINWMPTADSATYICSCLAQVEVEVNVRKPMGCAAGHGHGGLFPSTSGTSYTRSQNPYLKTRYFEYVEVVRPVEIANRIMSIREEIAAELAIDLQLLSQETVELLASLDMEGGGGVMDLASDASVGDVIPFAEYYPQEKAASSAYRYANFDLAKLLATREALLSILRTLQHSSTASDQEAFQWLFKFSEPHLDKFNVHHVWTHGRGDPSLSDEFIFQLITAAPNGDVKFTPLRLATVLLKKRNQLVSKWCASLVDTTGEEHLGWKRWHLSRSVTFSAQDEGLGDASDSTYGSEN